MKLRDWLEVKIMGINIWIIRRWWKKRFMPRKEVKGSISLKFGKRAPKQDYRTLKMATYSKGLPFPPDHFDNLETVSRKLGIQDPRILYPMDGNDRMGNCTIAGIAHALTVYNGLISERQIPPESDVVKLYRQLSRCGRDEGLVMLDVLKYWKNNEFYKHKILAFVRIDPKNHIHVKQAIQRFGGVYLGFQVHQGAINDFENKRVWVPGPLTNGGHAIFATTYGPERVRVLTWGDTQEGTWEWWDATVDECYAILPPEAMTDGFCPGFDWAQLQADIVHVSN